MQLREWMLPKDQSKQELINSTNTSKDHPDHLKVLQVLPYLQLGLDQELDAYPV